MNLFSRHPHVVSDVFVAPSASIIGEVQVNSRSSVWYGSVVRGDLGSVYIGGYTSIQDRAVVQTVGKVEGLPDSNVRIGDYVVVGTAIAPLNGHNGLHH